VDASCFPDLHDADRTARFAEHLIVHLVKRQDGWEIVEIFEGENNPHIHSKKKKKKKKRKPQSTTDTVGFSPSSRHNVGNFSSSPPA
jgi:hypothetical protein